ncbi:MAG: hypothetical protein NTX27_12345 [Verrucomicrobia bacterium]|nr:hypothetical protein [Verrucomicrobiota bacterium]
MKTCLRRMALTAALVWVGMAPLHATAQETVTIPKSRLEELERKAAELDRIKADLHQTKSENAKLQVQNQEARAKLAAAPGMVETNTSPAISTLGSLTESDIVPAVDLANHFKFEQDLAKTRYGNRKFRVSGIITGFEKPAFVRPYKIFLRTNDPRTIVACEFIPEERFSAVYPVKNGTELRGMAAGTPVTIARLGDHVVIDGQCKGNRESGVALKGSRLDISR